MSIIKITGLSFWLLGCCLSLSGQSTYHIQRFTTDNGLPSNGIKGLQWDAQTGFLWIATEAGVKTLVLSHLVPGGTDVTDASWREAAAKYFKGEIIVGRDMMVV